jgi:hypothetical protein
MIDKFVIPVCFGADLGCQQATLELGQAGEDVQNEFAVGGSGIESAVVQGFKANAATMKLVHQIDLVPQRASRPVERPDDEGIEVAIHAWQMYNESQPD